MTAGPSTGWLSWGASTWPATTMRRDPTFVTGPVTISWPATLELEACGVRVKQAACRRMRWQHRDQAAA